MLSAYENYRQENKVLPVPKDFDNVKQLVINTLHAGLRTPVLVLLLTVLLLLPFYIAYRIKNTHP